MGRVLSQDNGFWPICAESVPNRSRRRCASHLVAWRVCERSTRLPPIGP
jgi:hypothetical protein